MAKFCKELKQNVVFATLSRRHNKRNFIKIQHKTRHSITGEPPNGRHNRTAIWTAQPNRTTQQA